MTSRKLNTRVYEMYVEKRIQDIIFRQRVSSIRKTRVIDRRNRKIEKIIAKWVCFWWSEKINRHC